MLEVTLGIAVLLTAGLLFAKLAQLLHLPSVTGFILAGLIIGPSGLGYITADTVGHRLDHFTQIALMLIAFGIGEHIELRRLGSVAKDVSYISIVQAIGAYIFVMTTTCATSWLVSAPDTPFTDHLILSLLLGAVAVATAPAAILHVVRELGARGPMTSTLMAVIAVDDGIAIMGFGITLSIAHQLAGQNEVSALYGIMASISEIGFSIAMGIATGFLIDFTLHKMHKQGEMLTAGLAILLLCGEITTLLHLSPLLAGMMAGFTIINRGERDVRLFRALNAFEPPVYVLFFTLAGVHLDLAALKLAGWIGIAYFISRIFGKYLGTWLGGVLSGAAPAVRNYLGLALIPQAGVAIGLVFLISSDPQLSSWSTIITPIVLGGVFLSELFGPLLVHLTIDRAGETATNIRSRKGRKHSLFAKLFFQSPDTTSLAPWSWDTLYPSANTEGVVIFGASNFATVRGLSRVATILAHHYHALPMSLRVLETNKADQLSEQEIKAMFLSEVDETKSLGYSLLTKSMYGSVTSQLITAVKEHDTKAVVLGYPPGRKSWGSRNIVNKVAANITCPVISVRFVGTFSSDHILVPFIAPQELNQLLPFLEAMGMARQPLITFLYLLNADSSRDELTAAESELQQWLETNLFDIETRPLALPSESRLETILNEAKYHDLIIMKDESTTGIKRLFFGSLAHAVVKNSHNPILIVHLP